VTRDQGAALIAFLVTRPAARARLLRPPRRRHGHCRVCTVGGQRGHLPWPCAIAASATEAERLALSRSRSSPQRR
jgi:hypothetical protein